MGLNIISDKFKAVSTILTAVCAICSISWIIFKEIHTYNTQKEDVKFTKEQVMSFKNDMDSLRNENEKLKAEIFSLKIHLEPVFDFMNNQLYDYMHNNIRFKQTSDGKLFFYYNNGYYYNIIYDDVTRNYYYIAEDNKSYWCK